MKIGRKLKTLRLKHNLTMEELGNVVIYQRDLLVS